MINYELDGGRRGHRWGLGNRPCRAHALACSGARVPVDLAMEALDEAVAELEQYGRPTRTATVDVSDSGRVTEAMEALPMILVESTLSWPTPESVASRSRSPSTATPPGTR